MTRFRFLLGVFGLQLSAQKKAEKTVDHPGIFFPETVGSTGPRIRRPKNGECPACGTVIPSITKKQRMEQLNKTGRYQFALADMPDSAPAECGYCRCHFAMELAK